MTEVRVTSATGGEKGMKPEKLGGGDPLAFIELAKVYAMGEDKYARYNYLKGYDWSLSVDALFRHLLAFLSGEDRDAESGLLHTAHVAWHAHTLTSFQLRAVGTDDRPPSLAPPTTTVEELLETMKNAPPPFEMPEDDFVCACDEDGKCMLHEPFTETVVPWSPGDGLPHA